ncbi:hypothetical protein AB0451_19745 [Streptomyces sp. NPDC052000]|uniref:hypothetical protein n=1 Tax=Streptomyces sp. NPDC052000 TaxID=3155676 RepID=UPI00344ECEA7
MKKVSVRNLSLFSMLLSAGVLTGCSQGDESAKVEYSSIVGIWSGEDGGKVTFKSDGTFNATHMGGLSSLFSDCPKSDASGTWGFFQPTKFGDAVSDSAKSGSAIGLTFNNVRQGGCEVRVNVINSGASICFTDDPEVLCDAGFRLSKQSSPASTAPKSG